MKAINVVFGIAVWVSLTQLNLNPTFYIPIQKQQLRLSPTDRGNACPRRASPRLVEGWTEGMGGCWALHPQTPMGNIQGFLMTPRVDPASRYSKNSASFWILPCSPAPSSHRKVRGYLWSVPASPQSFTLKSQCTSVCSVSSPSLHFSCLSSGAATTATQTGSLQLNHAHTGPGSPLTFPESVGFLALAGTYDSVSSIPPISILPFVY